jgi:hypothetical protein
MPHIKIHHNSKRSHIQVAFLDKFWNNQSGNVDMLHLS